MTRPVLGVAAALLAGCASAPLTNNEYRIPVVKADDRLETFIVEPEPGDNEKLLFCIEFENVVLCVGAVGDKAFRYFMPSPDMPPDRGT